MAAVSAESEHILEGTSGPNNSASEEEEGKATSPLLVDSKQDPVDGIEDSQNQRAPKNRVVASKANMDDDDDRKGIVDKAAIGDNGDAHSWEQEHGLRERTASRQQRHQRSNTGLLRCFYEGELCSEIYKLSYAPRDLYIIYSIKVAECTAYYGTSYVYTHYLTEEFDFSDQQAGYLYAVYGLLCTVVGCCMGVSIDRLGVRRAVILGTVTTTIGRFVTAFASSSFAVTLAGVTFLPFGAAFGVPALALGVRRYTHESNRAFAFSFFYVALCLACMLGSVLINRVRAGCLDEVDAVGNHSYPCHWTWMRVVIGWSTVLTAYTIFASFYLRDIQVNSERPLESTSYDVRERGTKTSLKEVIEHPRFWRLFWVTMIFCGIRMTFRHLDATFPKYFIRTQGHDAPFEIVVGIEPFLTMFLSPVFTWLLVKFKCRLDQTLLLGAFISGASVYILAIEETYNAAIAFVIVLAVGESIWSPKLYEFSTMVAPEGREGIFVAISFAPVYLASVPVGALSGWALSTFCGRSTAPEERHGQLMWFIIGCFSFSSFVFLWLLRHRLFPPEDNEEAGDGEDDGDAL
mmetsp:Transcript_63524/g.98836  ORF Transcript_63524/g.98836 Transcript_63524/m.98836 type:complete len:575 (-) Transcript_63524:54-1778(-)